MRISMNQSEIELAIREYLSKMIYLSNGKKFNIEMSATRGASGFTADIVIVDDPSAIPPIKAVSEETGEVKEAAPAAELVPAKKNSLFSQIHTA